MHSTTGSGVVGVPTSAEVTRRSGRQTDGPLHEACSSGRVTMRLTPQAQCTHATLRANTFCRAGRPAAPDVTAARRWRHRGAPLQQAQSWSAGSCGRPGASCRAGGAERGAGCGCGTPLGPSAGTGAWTPLSLDPPEALQVSRADSGFPPWSGPGSGQGGHGNAGGTGLRCSQRQGCHLRPPGETEAVGRSASSWLWGPLADSSHAGWDRAPCAPRCLGRAVETPALPAARAGRAGCDAARSPEGKRKLMQY